MRIVNIVPGSGNSFYCENCLRDSALVKALRRSGHDVVMVPLYLPLALDDPGLTGDTPVFYGAVNLYLKHVFPWLRRMPAALSRRLDAPRSLAWAARRAGSTRARGLEDMTISMLRGEEGRQAAELERLVDWLRESERPDVVHLSSALLLGLARRLRDTLGVPIVCSLQDEDVWLDAMRPSKAAVAWRTLTERAAAVDVFVTVSRYYAERMSERLQLAPARLRVIRIGIELEGYQSSVLPFDPPVIGFLSRLSSGLGLGLLVDAFLELKADPAFRNLQLRATGGSTADDRSALRSVIRKLERAGLAGDVRFQQEFDLPARQAFLRELTVMCVPVPGGEAFGTYMLESMAAGVPVLQPREGAFPEAIELTGGGELYAPDRPGALAAALRSLLSDPQRVRELGRRGREKVSAEFGIDRMARETVALYRDALAAAGTRPGDET